MIKNDWVLYSKNDDTQHVLNTKVHIIRIVKSKVCLAKLLGVLMNHEMITSVLFVAAWHHKMEREAARPDGKTQSKLSLQPEDLG